MYHDMGVTIQYIAILQAKIFKKSNFRKTLSMKNIMSFKKVIFFIQSEHLFSAQGFKHTHTQKKTTSL